MLGASAGLGLALGTPLAHAAAAGADAPRAAAADLTPREVIKLDAGWRFHLGHASDPARDFNFGINQAAYAKSGAWNWPQGPVTPAYDDSDWTAVDLPHDWAIDLPFIQPAYLDPTRDDVRSYHGYKPLGREYPDTSIGWYRRVFALPAADTGRRLSLEFEGVFRDALVFVNGYVMGRNDSGYAPFRIDITDVAIYGAANVVVVRADATEGEGWFYEGAGIYRNVWLVKTDPVHVPQYGTFVRAAVSGQDAARTAGLAITTEIANESAAPRACEVVSTVFDPSGRPVAVARGAVNVAAWQTVALDQRIDLTQPRLWSIESPNLYRLQTEIRDGARTLDRYATSFGVRTIRFDANQGFFLNEVPVKVKGTCNHQDHAGVGSAIPDRLQAWRIEQLKAMGSNAYRTSHNPPAPAVLDACDRLGMLVLDETRRMSVDAEALDELTRLVRRDRNRPSVFLWSIGNEEPHEVTDTGRRTAETMKRHVIALDGTRPVTAAMNFGWGVGMSSALDVMGFNYSPDQVAPYHAKFPSMPIIGTETASTVTTRGVYERDAVHHYPSAYDVEAPPWAQTAQKWWGLADAEPYMAGGFVWTGFDYRGEPTPFNRWPSVASSFGLMDSCGFPKDEYYYYKAWWDSAPLVHLFPHWTWPGREGKAIDVWCYSNLDRVELFVNGKSAGMQTVTRDGHLAWSVPYAPGAIEAHGYKGDRLVARERRETAGPAARIALGADRVRLAADGEDLAVVSIAILDAAGRPVPDAADEVQLDVSGPAIVLGMGNGDPTSHAPDRASARRAFKGLCMGLIQAKGSPGRVRVSADADGLKGAELTIVTS
jgi:beta-galactosidase